MRNISIILLLSIYLVSSAQDTVFVKSEGVPFTNTEDHNSWESATNSLQNAMNALSENGGGQIWVKNGIYYPTDTIPGTVAEGLEGTDSLRMTSFVLKDDVYLFGGFIGIEERIDQRMRYDINNNDSIEPWEFSYPTILSGDINIPDDSTDNCFHVVYGTDCNKELIKLDGFTITEGNSSKHVKSGAGAIDANIVNCIVENNYASSAGGGLSGCEIFNSLIINNQASYAAGINNCEAYSSVIRKNIATSVDAGGALSSFLLNCVVDSNRAHNGGGVYAGYCYNCLISSNVADNFGGGLLAVSAGNCRIINNKAVTGGGGAAFHGAFTYYSTLTNCIISNNSAASFGGTRTYHLINCVVSMNEAYDVGGAGTYLSKIYNTIIWGNTNDQGSYDGNYKYCAIEGGFEGENNLDLDPSNSFGPMFINPSDSVGTVTTSEGYAHILNADWTLQEGSACIDSGNYVLIPDSIQTDYEGKLRIMGTNIDIGAFEFTDDPFIPPGTGLFTHTLSDDIKIFPTITSDILKIESPNTAINQIIIVSTNGQRNIYELDYSQINEISISNLSSGIYFVIVSDSEKILRIEKICKTNL